MAKRLGRGYGSGKGGHTSSRGQKGQKTRATIHILFEGLKVKKSTIKKFPLLRGKGKFRAKPRLKVKYISKAERGLKKE
jgi:ribosomal protein L15